MGNCCLVGTLRHWLIAKPPEGGGRAGTIGGLKEEPEVQQAPAASFLIAKSFCSRYDPPLLKALSLYSSPMTARIIDHCIIEGVWNELLLQEQERLMVCNSSGPGPKSDKMLELCPGTSESPQTNKMHLRRPLKAETSNKGCSDTKFFWCIWKTPMHRSITVSSSTLTVHNSLPGKKTESYMWSFCIGYDIPSSLAPGARAGTILWNLTGRAKPVGDNRTVVLPWTLILPPPAPFQLRVHELNHKKTQDRNTKSGAAEALPWKM